MPMLGPREENGATVLTAGLSADVKAGSSVTLVLGLAFALAGALWLVWELPPDGAVHLLGAGLLSTLILGVVARVVRFFSGTAALNDRLLCYVLLVWGGVVGARVGTTLGWSMGAGGLLAVLGVGAVLWLGWSGRVALCLWRIGQKRVSGQTER